MTGSNRDSKLFHCPALLTLKIISGKWKTRILWLLRERPHYFGELRQTLPGISAKVLTEQIRELEEDGIVFRREAKRRGIIHVDYDFSEYGRSLIPVLDAIGTWGIKHDELSS